MSRSPSVALSVRVAMDTDVGRKRKQNQDAIGHHVPPDPERLGQIFVLADGVGGLTGGDLASQYAVSTIISSYYEQTEGEPPERLARAIAEANNVIYAEGQGQDVPTTMATTVVAAVIRGRELVIGSVGDSPAYLMRDAEVRKLTLDHTVEQMQREAGISPVENSPLGRKLVRALGSQPSVKVDIITGKVRGGDHIVLCSDGLTRYVSPQEIESTVAVLSPERAVKTLIKMANDRGGADNISVIVLKLTDEDATLMQEAASESGDGAAGESGRTVLHQPPDPARVAARPVRETPLRDLWWLLRSNAILTGIGFLLLLVAFILIMLVVFNAVDEEPDGTDVPQFVILSEADQTATADAHLRPTYDAATGTAAVRQTQAVIEATASAAATPTPAAPSGPQMEVGMWFKVLDGDPIPAYEPDASGSPPRNLDTALEATPLNPDETFRVEAVDNEAPNGFWYLVVDNSGIEQRWVNGPSLSQRIVAVDAATSNPLPADQQPPDIPALRQSPTPGATITPSTTAATDVPGTPSTPVTPDQAAPTPDYPLQQWDGLILYAQIEFLLRDAPSLSSAETDVVAVNEAGRVIDGPEQADGHWWWKLRFSDGREGWVAQPLLSFTPVE